MKDTKINATIAIVTLIAAVLMCAALSFAIGKWSFGKTGYELTIKFPNATGINANSEVKFAGAHAGRVKEVRLHRARAGGQGSAHGALQIAWKWSSMSTTSCRSATRRGDDQEDGFASRAKYVLLTPGPSHDSPALVAGDVVPGRDAVRSLRPDPAAGEALTRRNSS